MIEQQLFSELQKQFLLDRQSGNKSQRTIFLYNKEISYFSKWLGEKPISIITSSLLREWFAFLSKTRNQGGVRVNYVILKTMCNWIEFEYEDPNWKNPIKKISIKPHNIPPLPEIPIEDIKRLIELCDTGRNSLRDKTILYVMFDTGVRASELLALRIQDVNLITGMVSVINGKGSKNRICWLGAKSISYIKDYLATREYKNDDPLFLNDEHKPLKSAGLRMLIDRLCKKAGIDFSPHCFRRAFAKTVYTKTHDIYLTSKLLGHSNPTVTLRYLHIGNEELRDSFSSPADLL